MPPLLKPIPRVLEKAERKARAEQQKRDVFHAVNQRDKYRCRACGRMTNPTATDMLRRGHHHHLEFRSRGGDTDTCNVLLLCALCHANVHMRELLIAGDADTRVTFSQMKDGVLTKWRG